MPCDRIPADRVCVGVMDTTSRAGPFTPATWELPHSFSPLWVDVDKQHDLKALMQKIVEPQDKRKLRTSDHLLEESRLPAREAY